MHRLESPAAAQLEKQETAAMWMQQHSLVDLNPTWGLEEQGFD
jgi:hypothetical protein